MMEAKVTCVCRSARINDLGKFLKQGESFVIDEDKARKSVDLAQMKQAGGVIVEYTKKPDMRPAPSSNGHHSSANWVSTLPVQAPPDPTVVLLQQLQQEMQAFRRELPVLVDKAVAKALADRDRTKQTSKVEEIGPRKKRS